VLINRAMKMDDTVADSGSNRVCEGKGQKIGASWFVRGILLAWTIIYLLAGGGALFASIAAERQQPASSLAHQLKSHARPQLVVGLVCAAACIVTFRKSRHSDLAVGFAACWTGFAAIKAIASGLSTGFHVYHLMEPVLILPGVAYLIIRLITSKPSPNPDARC